MTDSSSFKSYFRRHVGAGFTTEWVRYDSQFVTNQLRFIERFYDLNSLRSKAVLEIGSGMGRLSLLLRDRGFQDYTGVELDSEAAAFTKAQFERDGFQFVCSSLAEYSARKDRRKFAGIFCFETMEHLETPLDSIRMLHDLLAPGGVFIGTSPYPFRRNIESDNTHVSVLHPLNWGRLFVRAGFEVVALRPMSFLPYLWRLSGRLNVVLPFHVPVLNFVSTTLIIATRIDENRSG